MMKRLTAFPVLWVVVFALASCAVDDESPGSAPGDCVAEDGSITNTHEVIGKWKKVSSSFEDETSEKDREFNYDVFILEPGNIACMARVENKQAQAEAIFTANYVHEVDSQILGVTYLSNQRYPELKDATENITYSFGGSCEETRLTLSYPTGDTEVFEVFSTTASQGDCQVGEN